METGETGRLILQAAQRLFAAHGYRAVTTRQIAEACGITQPALYKHFADKQEIYVAMLLLEVMQIQTALERLALREASLDERLRLMALYMLTNTHHDVGMMTHDMSNELTPEAREILERAFIEGLVNPIASLFEAGTPLSLAHVPPSGSISPTMAALIFLNFIDLFTSQAFHGLVSETRGSVTEQAQLIVQLSLHGVTDLLERKEYNT
ncbi:MAG: TetR/AcrR family transcriptional regulator [Ktedonobacteraceae bacterium]